MRPRTIAATCLLTAALAIAPNDAHAQAADRARIVGTVTESSGSVLPGVRVTLTADGSTQEKVSDVDGSFAFDNLQTGIAYRVQAELTGFAEIHWDVPTLAPGETARSTLPMHVNLCGGIIDFMYPPWDERLLTADAILHVRTRDVVTRTINDDDYCPTVSETPAEILGVAHASLSEWRVGANVALVAEADWGGPLKSNTEYLVLLKYSANRQVVFVDAMFEVIGGRTSRLPFSETSRNSPIAETLAALRLAYERNTRHRRRDDPRETSFETLRYKTGWVWLGNLAAAPGTYVEQPLQWLDGGPTFEFADGHDALHAMPKRNDRVRLKEDTPVLILDYGASGEAKRNVLPTAQGNEPGFKDSTGRHAEAGRSYKVADVRVAESDGNAPAVWVRLVAGR